MHSGVTYGKGVPDHLAIHKLIADVPPDQLASWYKPHVEQPIGKRSVPTQHRIVGRRRTMQGKRDVPAVP